LTRVRAFDIERVEVMSMSRSCPCRALHLLLGLALLGLAGTLSGQDLEPRAYSAAPVGTRFLVAGLGYSTGSVLLDPSVPITDVRAKIGLLAPAYLETFRLFGRTASLTLILPYAVGKMSGSVGEGTDRQTVTRSGFGDLRLRLALNLLGNPALTLQEFARRKPATTLGISMTVVMPTGQYDPAHLINVGTNRWAFKPEIGLSHPMGKWVLDLATAVWLFTDNPNFYGGQLRSQDPLWATQGHLSYSFRPGLWLAFDATYYAGGRTTVNGAVKDDQQGNTRSGLTLAVPFAKAYALKFSWSTGVVTRIGGNFTSFGVAFQYRWFGR
jgi:hypothetical protein